MPLKKMNKIINILKQKKPLPIDEFINLALYNKKFGYYMKKNPFGEDGDYITSPLVSKLFAEMITIWCVSFWEKLDKPNKIIIAELGPGDGSLCKDFLSTAKNFKDFYNCLELRLLEKSNKLKRIQKTKIEDKKVKWIKKIEEINSGPIIFIGNEFFDALSIKQFYKKKKLLFERYVGFNKNNKKIEFLYKKANKNLVKKIKNLQLISSGNIIEYPINAIKYLNLITKKINKYNGGLLCFDYGYTKQKNQDTLQSISNHKYINILSDPGNCDITSHINYELFSKFLIKNNLHVENIISQNEFLQKLGIIDRANILSKKVNFKTKMDMFYRLKKLLNNSEMGNIFKVLFAKKKGIKFSLGF
jgi:cyclopropane-fatty-acyl-phospholipid synthase